MSEIDEYMKQATPSQKNAFERFRELVKETVPDAEETISYGVPTFKYKKKPLVYFGVFKDHMSIFPASDGMMTALGEELTKFRVSKGTLRFTEVDPIPESTLEDIIRYRLKSILEK